MKKIRIMGLYLEYVPDCNRWKITHRLTLISSINKSLVKLFTQEQLLDITLEFLSDLSLNDTCHRKIKINLTKPDP